jgi:hypothetical protein
VKIAGWFAENTRSSQMANDTQSHWVGVEPTYFARSNEGIFELKILYLNSVFGNPIRALKLVLVARQRSRIRAASLARYNTFEAIFSRKFYILFR